MSEQGESPESRFLGDVDIFQWLTDQQLNALVAIGRRQVFPPGEVLIRAGDPADKLYAILRGTVSRLAPSEETELTIVGTVGPSTSIPLLVLVDPPIVVNTLRTATEVEAFVIPRAPLMELLNQQPAIGMHLCVAALPVIGERYRDALNQLVKAWGEAAETEKRRTQAEIGATHQQLLQSGKLAALGELISTVAHEMNNPLTGVLGFAQLLLRRDLEEEVKRDVEVIYEETQRVVRIVQDLLVFARKREHERGLMSVNEAIEKTLALREYDMRVNNLKVVRHLQPDLPQTVADFHQMQQVFLNMIINAEQAMSEAHGQGTLVVKTQQVGERIQIIFANDGPGIPRENLTGIFDPFFTTKGETKGTGLGLSLCRGIVQDHRGTIRVESKEGRGVTFIIEIPLVLEETTSVLPGMPTVSSV